MKPSLNRTSWKQANVFTKTKINRLKLVRAAKEMTYMMLQHSSIFAYKLRNHFMKSKALQGKMKENEENGESKYFKFQFTYPSFYNEIAP